ncbi:hypothetical protein ACHAW5_000858 [Stephanodiscus triporus]|uniref:Uncharacterized protein n=1 Tax=Stephanodiscus triporus TaxID=2934178 RepID=A0ABD3PU32_9STRA
MASAKCLRRSICTVIASAGTKQTEIVSELDNIFGNYESFASDWGELDDNVTPLMLACDKCCSEALIYLRTQISAVKYNSQPMKHLIEAWGHPDEASSHGNRASHHALAAGFSEGLDLLENIWGCFEEETQKSNEENSGEGSDHLRRYLSLLSQTNHNGDTPLMMACVSGHDDIVRSLLRRSVQLALNTRPDDTKASVSETWQLLKDIFNIRNGEECTALNLACGHGHPDIVKVLIEQHHLEVNSNNDFIEVNLLCGMDNNLEVNSNNDPTAADHLCCYKEKTMADEAIYTCSKLHKMNPLVDVTFTDIDFCKNTLENLSTRLKFKERLSRKMIEELSFQRKNSDECLAMMECELDRLATKTANELLLLDYNSAKSTRPIISSGAKRVKIRNRQRRTTRKDSSSNVGVLDGVINATKFDDVTGNDGWKHAKNEPALKCPIKSSPFITLQDGTVVSKYQKSEFDAQISVLADNLCINDVNSDESKISKEAKTFQRILQSTNTLSSNDDDIAALMESLCLDPAMLLLSPHGMAIEMSPCQLDAIGTILKQQLRATKEAQQIQRRLFDKQSNA